MVSDVTGEIFINISSAVQIASSGRSAEDLPVVLFLVSSFHWGLVVRKQVLGPIFAGCYWILLEGRAGNCVRECYSLSYFSCLCNTVPHLCIIAWDLGVRCCVGARQLSSQASFFWLSQFIVLICFLFPFLQILRKKTSPTIFQGMKNMTTIVWSSVHLFSHKTLKEQLLSARH